ncbi:prolyl oligopeptidase family serine peptidase [Occultella aeris]|uniref:Prolyl tripeptidyl peptidase n=1 Tax=Occultella aeris TaxID=2761496 RepID=A0A7M4DEC6_9MICO|nr:Prolyl tripeptidyl peptidase precursor [Occultella aeris]
MTTDTSRNDATTPTATSSEATADGSAAPTEAAAPPTPFHDLDAYLALPRASGLALSPDGTRLVVGVAALNHDSTAYVTSQWDVDPSGERPARRLTRGTKGESQATFTASGDLLFVAKRAIGETGEDKAKPALWVLPAAGGEARVLATRPGGVGGITAARAADTVIVTADTLPSATDTESEQRLRDLRSDNKVNAILHTGYPVRYWDSDLGPDRPRLFAAEASSAVVASAPDQAPEDEADPDAPLELRDLTPDAGAHLTNTGLDLSADGATAVTSWNRPMAKGAVRSILVRIDVASGERTTIADEAEADLGAARISPDGTRVAYLRETLSTPESAPEVTLWIAGIDGSDPQRIAAGWDRWPASFAWLPDSSGLLVTADDDGRSPVYKVTLDGTLSRLTPDDGAYSDVVVATDGSVAYALRSSYAHPAEVVRIDLADGATEPVTALRSPSPRPSLPGTLREVETTAVDGSRVRAWLAVPEGASEADPAPLVLWIHGGPLGSWNAWSWRWCPWLLVAQGYAVLLPDPALSTGYGQDFIQRGWGAWGEAPFTDLMAVTDAAEALPEIDGTRTGAMGGSFGGYMANWVAGHTDRFKGIVTHASLWALDGFGTTTDAGYFWGREMTPQMALANSPHLSVERIATPMLVVHGDKDYRVPIGEGLRLWYELLSKSALPADEDGRSPHRFLYFPDENHWVLTPQHAKVWYQVVGAFLAEHVLGQEAPVLPETLG